MAFFTSPVKIVVCFFFLILFCFSKSITALVCVFVSWFVGCAVIAQDVGADVLGKIYTHTFFYEMKIRDNHMSQTAWLKP